VQTRASAIAISVPPAVQSTVLRVIMSAPQTPPAPAANALKIACAPGSDVATEDLGNAGPATSRYNR
jgi:hypothetical protein